MKKRIIMAGSLAALSSAADTAQAQNSVTLYGVIDAGLTYVSNSNGPSRLALTGGNESGGRWGLQGKENLGAGLSAIFTLESGFNPVNGTLGQNGTQFGRQVFVGLDDSTLGTLTLGRQYASAADFVNPFSAGATWAASGNVYGAHPADLDNLNNSNRINNTIKYRSLNYGGFSFGGLYSLGGQPGSFTKNQIWSVGAGYAKGPLKLAAGYLSVERPNFSFWGDKANDSPTGNNIANPIIRGYASANAEHILTAGISYTIGLATVNAVYSNTQFSGLGSVAVAGLPPAQAAYTGHATFNSGELNLTYQVSAPLFLGVSYDYTDGTGAGQGSARYHQIDLGAVYSLSKRTDLYAVGVFQKAAGTDSTGGAAVAAIIASAPSKTDRQVVATAGIRHRF